MMNVLPAYGLLLEAHQLYKSFGFSVTCVKTVWTYKIPARIWGVFGQCSLGPIRIFEPSDNI